MLSRYDERERVQGFSYFIDVAIFRVYIEIVLYKQKKN